MPGIDQTSEGGRETANCKTSNIRKLVPKPIQTMRFAFLRPQSSLTMSVNQNVSG